MIGKKLTNKKALVLVCLLGMLLGMTGCSGRKTVLLESEDLVRAEGQTEDEDSFEALEETLEQVEQSTLFVHICGEVMRPGVYELPEGSRVYEALARAGGLRKDAYEKDINQAEQIEDGQMIEVLTRKEYMESQEQKRTDEKGMDPDQKLDQRPDGRIDLNTATKEQLMTLSGIGEAKAANIIAYRESCGGFSTPDEIMNVSGIGEGVYARIQDKITVMQ